MKKKNKNPQEIIDLIEICEKHFKCDVKERNKVQNNVNARMTISNLLRRKGYIYQSIGKALDRTHATIIHHERKIDSYLESDKEFKDKYLLVEEEFHIKYNPMLEMTKQELINKIILLDIEKKELLLGVDRLVREKYVKVKKYNRVQGLINIVHQRTKLGKEIETEKGLNIWYNGLHN